MKATDVAAYTYQAEVYCPTCVRTMAAYALAGPDEAAFMGRPSDGDTAEQFVQRWADMEGVDYSDGASYDSDGFPKPVFASEVDGDAAVWVCGECFELIA